MCLGVPMQVIETDGWFGRCAGRGEERVLRLMMLVEDVAPGDWVLAHMDSAVQVLTAEEAATVNAALDVIAVTARGGDAGALLDRVMAGVPLPSQQADPE